MQWLRLFSTKRTVPYITKGNWKLPTASVQSTITPTAANGWGTQPQQEGVNTQVVNVPKNWRQLRTLPQWKRQMFALKEKFPEGWNPMRKLSRNEMEELRQLKRTRPQLSLNELGSMFRISPEAVRRILRSRWTPSATEKTKIDARWIRRGERMGARTVNKVTRKLGRMRDASQDIF